jgi:hypothetical protein
MSRTLGERLLILANVEYPTDEDRATVREAEGRIVQLELENARLRKQLDNAERLTVAGAPRFLPER